MLIFDHRKSHDVELWNETLVFLSAIFVCSQLFYGCSHTYDVSKTSNRAHGSTQSLSINCDVMLQKFTQSINKSWQNTVRHSFDIRNNVLHPCYQLNLSLGQIPVSGGYQDTVNGGRCEPWGFHNDKGSNHVIPGCEINEGRVKS
jgi:hypothetical protein